jgi:topoisomerase IA-like protein
MKKIILLAAVMLGLSVSAMAQEGYKFTDTKVLKTVPITNQYRSGTCWCFSTLSYLEEEILAKGGDQVTLSQMWIIRNAYFDKAVKYVRLHGNLNFAVGGAAHDVTEMIKKYGAVPLEAYPGYNYGTELPEFGEIDAVLLAYVEAVIENKNGKITTKEGKETVGAEKAKLIPTDIGIVVNDFLFEYFPEIMDYNFTATVEKEFDEIADGKRHWADHISVFYKEFEPKVDGIIQTKKEHKVGERVLGNDPASGKPVSVKIGRFGPIVQIGSASDEEKPRFAQMKPGQTLETITLEEALGLFSLPRTLGELDGQPITIGAGRFGAYIKYGNAYVSLPKTHDPLTVTLEEATELIEAKKKSEAERIIKTFEEESELQVLNGRFGPYIAYKGSNYKLPKSVTPAELTLQECMEIVNKQQDGGKAPAKRRYTKKSK